MSLPVASIQSKQNAITIPIPMRSGFAPQLSNVITNSVVIQETNKPSSVSVVSSTQSQQSTQPSIGTHSAPQLAIQTTISAPLIGGQSAPLSVLTSGSVGVSGHQTAIIGGGSSSLPIQTQIVPQTTINTPLINAPLSIQTGGHQTINTTIGSHATPLSVLTSGAQQTIAAQQTTIGSHTTPLSLQSVQSSGGQQIAINVTTLTPSQQQQQQQQQQFQRLKVEDALSYLDQVKFKFNNQPQVYNDFLDIMKEFKSQSIDTPGVIQRVSTLFKGHPELIVGFNTFLPPGYKIEMHANDQVNVSMPNAPSTILLSGTPLGSTSTIVGPSIQHQVIGNLPKAGVVQTTNYSGSQSHQAAINVALAAATNQSRTTAHHDIPSQHPLPSQQTPVSTSTVNANSNNSSSGATGGGSAATSLPNGSTTGTATAASGAQPVEFNHAINYVNKIKNRFQGQPEIYKQFLEILHTYQKEQRSLKEGTAVHSQKMLTETEVFTQVAKLFQNQEDLLQEFSQFLPDANSSNVPAPSSGQLSISGQIPAVQFGHPLAHHVENIAAHVANNDRSVIVKKPTVGRPTLNTQPFTPRIQLKRSQHDQLQHHGSIKRQKMTSLRDVSLAEAGKYGSLNEFAFFDKVRKALRSQEVYENFLRCLVLYNHEILSRSELVHLVTPFLGRFPELLKWFKDFLGYKEGASAAVSNTVNSNSVNNSSHTIQLEGLSHRMAIIRERERERINSEIGMEIDYSSCKRYGASYRALPKNFIKPECSGRTPLCREVLNDTWVSFPSWSEDSTFVSSRKTQYEEYIYRCEDERYELDVVLETNLSTIRVLEAIQKKLSRMTPEDRNRYKLDDTLGGTSSVIHQKAIRRIYGDKAQEIIEGLKKNPSVAVPLVIRRLMMKEEEWREAQKQFNKIWREQNEKYYLKSLDHQGISFKQNDIKFLRSKSLLNEIEISYEERHEENEANASATADGNNNSVSQQPHMTFTYSDPSMIEEACNLIIHHVKRQTSIHKEDKQKIKLLLRQFIPDFYGTHRGELSDDEMEDMDTSDEKDKPVITNAITSSSDLLSGSGYNSRSVNKSLEKDVTKKKVEKNLIEENVDSMGDNNNSQLAQHKRNLMLNLNPEDTYVLFFVNNNWYLFFRLHQILCERLSKMFQRAKYLAAEEAREKRDRKESTAVALRLKPNNDIEVEDYFPAFVDMIKQVLDGNLDSNQYEDMLREMFGIHAYIAFTMDKVVQNIVRQLQHIVGDDTCVQCTELFLEEVRSNGTGGLCATSHHRIAAEAYYQKRAEQLLSDENCFKIILYKSEGKLCIEMVDTETDESGDELEQIAKWSDYVERYARELNISDELKQQLSNKPLFMRRNIRTFKSRTKNERENLIDKDFKNEKNKEECNSSGKEEELSPNESSQTKALSDTDVKENNECKFNMNSFKLVFVVQSESVLYRRRSIKKAKMSHKRVSQRLYEKFNKWHQNWLENSSTEDQQRRTQEWLVNHESIESTQNQTNNKDIKISATIATSSDSKTNINATKSSLITATKSLPTVPSTSKLSKLVINNEDKPPYRKFCRYRTEELSKREQSLANISATN